MSKYRMYVTAAASQIVEVEADSLAEAIGKAYEEHDLYENISNAFEFEGEVEVLVEHSTVDGEPIPEATP